jgi:hypothetical protein
MSDHAASRGPIPPTAREVWDLAAFIRSRLADDLGNPPYKKPVARLYSSVHRTLTQLAPAAEALVQRELTQDWVLAWDALVEMASPWANHPDYKASYGLRSDGTQAGSAP